MKKFWNLMLALYVVLGIAGCTTVDGGISDGMDEGFSFIASIDHTRTDVISNGGVWQTVWSGDDILYVTSDKGNFTFTNSASRPSRFVAEAEGAEVLREASNIVITTQHDGGCVVDSDAGKRGLALRGEYELFPEDGRVSLGIQSAFFRLACSQDVTLEADAAIFSGVDGSAQKQVNSVTVGAGDDIWVAFEPCVEKVSLTVTVAGKAEMFVEELALSPCVIYTLGRITPTIEPEPEPQKSYIYLVPNSEWKRDGAWFVAYFANDNGENIAVGFDGVYGDGAYRAEVPEGMTSVLFCRMNPAYTEFGPNDAENTRIWAMTTSTDIGVVPYNYFYITGTDTGEWNRAGYNPNGPSVDPATWAVAGTFNNWGDELMSETDDPNIFVKRSLKLNAGDEFKIKIKGSWDKNYGAIERLILNPNEWLRGYHGGHNIPVAYSDTYDIYLDAAQERIYLMISGVDYTNATEYGKTVGWAVTGTFNGWSDEHMTATNDPNIFVKRSLKLNANDEFMIKTYGSWDNYYGAAEPIVILPNEWLRGYQGGYNIPVGYSRTYDIYFDVVQERIYLMESGVDYTTATEQGTTSLKPAPTEDEWGVCGTHNNWGLDGVKDTPLLWDGELEMYVAYNVTLTGEFKMRSNNSWDDNYGGNCSVTVDDIYPVYMYSYEDNCYVTPGTYDVYFSLFESVGRVWVRTPGSDAPVLFPL